MVFGCRYIRAHTVDNASKIHTIAFNIFFAIFWYNYTNTNEIATVSISESTSLDKIIRCNSKGFILTQRLLVSNYLLASHSFAVKDDCNVLWYNNESNLHFFVKKGTKLSFDRKLTYKKCRKLYKVQIVSHMLKSNA